MSQWYVNDSGREVGPLSSPELRRMAREGRIRPDTWLRQVGQGGWIPASRVKGLFDGPALGELPPPNYNPSPVTHLPAHPMMAAPPAFGQPAYGQAPAQQAYAPPQVMAPAAPPPPPPRRNKPAAKGRFPTALIVGGGAGAALLLLVAVGGAFFLLSRPKPQKVPLTDEQIVERSEKSIASLKGKINAGTAFLVRPGVLATNAHVIETEFVENLKVEFPAAPAKQRAPRVRAVIYSDPQRDLALLRVRCDLDHLTLAETYQHKRGQSVLVIGNPGFADGSLTNAPTPGMMGSETTLRGHTWYQLTINLNPGNSGGPVLDKYGEVIGIATATARGKAAMGFCIPAEDVAKGLDEVKNYGKADDERADMRHRARCTVKLLKSVCDNYNIALKEYILEMEKARLQNININEGIRVARNRIASLTQLYDSILTADVKPNMSKFNDSSPLDPKTRADLRDLWTIYEEMKDYFQNPRGTLDSFRNKQIELNDKYKKLYNGLKVDLGMRDD